MSVLRQRFPCIYSLPTYERDDVGETTQNGTVLHRMVLCYKYTPFQLSEACMNNKQSTLSSAVGSCKDSEQCLFEPILDYMSSTYVRTYELRIITKSVWNEAAKVESPHGWEFAP